MRNVKWWCGAKNNEAPQSFDSASRRRHLERSREISLAERSAHHLRYFDHRLLLIPHHSSLLSNLDLLSVSFGKSGAAFFPFAISYNYVTIERKLRLTIE